MGGRTEKGATPVRLPQLRRIRWAVRITLALGVAASVMANVLHALDNPVSQAIAAWPPLALLLTVELISRVPVDRRSLAAARLFATATIACIAAWVSYWHMAGVAARYGETGASAYLLPLSVDGLIIVASVCLVELGGRISTAEAERAAAAERRAEAERAEAARRAELQRAAAAERAEAERMAAQERAEAARLETARLEAERAEAAKVEATRLEAAARLAAAGMPAQRLASVPGVGSTMDAAAVTPKAASPRPKSTAGTARRRPMAETAALAAAIEAVQPDVTDADLARQLGISTSRLKTIKREMRATAPVSPAPANGSAVKESELAAA